MTGFCFYYNHPAISSVNLTLLLLHAEDLCSNFMPRLYVEFYAETL